MRARIRTTSLPAKQIEAGVHDNAMEPGRKRRTPLESTEITPHLQVRILDGILGVIWISKNLERDGHGARTRLGQQRVERLSIAGLRAVDQFLHGVGRGGARRFRPTIVWRFCSNEGS
jgi:hypothetical protein